MAETVKADEMKNGMPGAQAKAEVKIAYIGGGSRGWAPKLMEDLALCPLLSGSLFLYDIDRKAAQANTAVGESIFRHSDSRRVRDRRRF